MRATGFIAIDRSIFDHPALRKPARFRAWQWLISQAAWRPEGKRGTWGVVHLERGEVATSTWTLAQTWRWPQTNVRCFLNRLVRDGMIVVTATRSATRSATGPFLEHEISIITICNYDKFQNASTAAKRRSAQRPTQQSAEDRPQTPIFPGFVEPLTIQPSNQIKQADGVGLEGETKRSAPTGPKHGAQSSKHRTVYLLRGTEDWRVHAADYREVIGAEPLPDRFGGFWFYSLGEASRPAHQRTWRRPNAFGAAAAARPQPKKSEAS